LNFQVFFGKVSNFYFSGMRVVKGSRMPIDTENFLEGEYKKWQQQLKQ
jgi:hypothetical protein